MQKIKYWLYNFMYGRNGVDTLNKFLFVPIVILLIVNPFFNGITRTILMIVCWILIAILYFRMLSKNIIKRRKENNWFERKIYYLKLRIKQSKQFRFYDCPNCGTHLRVPRGAGSITITCKKCGHRFDRKA